jgi:O-antigen/teichoic acid export membrane protein
MISNDKLNPFFKLLASNSFYSIATAIVTFLANILSSRILGAQGRGQWVLYTNAINIFVLLLGFGLSNSAG